MDSKTLYTCGVDWQHEIGSTSTEFYESIEELKAQRGCWKRCGIVEVKMSATWVEPQTKSWSTPNEE